MNDETADFALRVGTAMVAAGGHEDQGDEQAVAGDVVERAGESIAALLARADELEEPEQIAAGSFAMYLAPGGSLVLVVESPGRGVYKQVFNRRAVRIAAKMLPAVFGNG